MPHTPKNFIRDPADWARDTGWINRKQADELRDALRGLLRVTDDLAAPVEDDEPEWPAIVEARRVLAKRVHRYPRGGKRVAAMREP